ncbi:helix-turn-helix domain-containing protein [Streptomyces sp. NPDC002758]
MGSPSRSQRVPSALLTSNDAPVSGQRIHGNGRLETLVQPDGSVIVPATATRAVLRALTRDLTARVRVDGGTVAPDVTRLLYALHSAAQHAEDRANTPSIERSSDNDTAPPPTATVNEVSADEAAAVLGCSAGYVRRLARAGTIRARRIGARAWAIDRTALDHYRHGTGTPP